MRYSEAQSRRASARLKAPFYLTWRGDTGVVSKGLRSAVYDTVSELFGTQQPLSYAWALSLSVFRDRLHQSIAQIVRHYSATISF